VLTTVLLSRKLNWNKASFIPILSKYLYYNGYMSPMAQPKPDQSATVQQLALEVANAYKVASERSDVIIQTLTNDRQTLLKQLEQKNKVEVSLRSDVADLQNQIAALHAQLGALQLQLDQAKPAAGDNVATDS
jgi:hypothetical protein